MTTLRITRRAVALAALAFAAPLFAGGFWVEFAHPSASEDPTAHGAFAVVRTIGCGEPTKASVVARAEGLVDGQRQFRPVRLVPMAQPGQYAIQFARPAEGSWVILVEARYNGVLTHALVPVGAGGFDRKQVKVDRQPPSTASVEALLRAGS